MQRLTKYRFLVCAFAVASVGLAAYCVVLKRTAASLRSEVTQAQARVTAGDVKLADRDRLIVRLKRDAAPSGTDQSNPQTAVRAFARQAEVCESVKQQLHIKE